MIMAKSKKCGCLIDVYMGPKPDKIAFDTKLNICFSVFFVVLPLVCSILLIVIKDRCVTRNTNQNSLHNPEPILTDRQLLQLPVPAPVPAPAPNEICCICLDS